MSTIVLPEGLKLTEEGSLVKVSRSGRETRQSIQSLESVIGKEEFSKFCEEYLERFPSAPISPTEMISTLYSRITAPALVCDTPIVRIGYLSTH